MLTLRIVPEDEKHLALRGVDPLIAQFLFEIPEILQLRDRPDVHARLYPDLIVGDASANAEWHETVKSDLHHLFADSGETVMRDLTRLDDGAVVFPIEHVNAWMNALNQARLILGELHHVTEHDMEAPEFDLDNPRQKALLQIHLFGYLLQLFVEHEQQGSV